MQRADYRLELLKLTPNSFGPEEMILRAKMFEEFLFEPEAEIAPLPEPVAEVTTKRKRRKNSDNVDPLS